MRGVGSSQPSFLLAERHDQKGWNDTRVGPVLPERAPSEGPRSTAAVGIPALTRTRRERGKSRQELASRAPIETK